MKRQSNNLSVNRVRYYILVFLTIAICNSIYCQKLSLSKVNGYVKDFATNQPIEYATVFINNTSLGCVTNSQGYFEIKNIPKGNFLVLCTFIGYQKALKEINISSDEIISLSFSLNQSPITFSEIQVVAKNDLEWKRNYRKFEQEFLGEGKNSSECVIENPEVIDLNLDTKNYEIIGRSDHEIKVVNNALGYSLRIILKEFVWSRMNEYGSIEYYPFFTELKPKDIAEKNRWEENRREAYKGSIRHFLKSCASNTLYEEGFRISNEIIPTSEEIREKRISTQKIYSNIVSALSIIEPLPNEQLEGIKASILEKQFVRLDENEFSLTNEVDSVALKKLIRYIQNKEDVKLENLCIKITYVNEEEDSKYINYVKRLIELHRLMKKYENGRSTYKFQNSWVKFADGKISFTKSGLLTSSSVIYPIRLFGYMAWERISNLLPWDYEPEEITTN